MKIEIDNPEKKFVTDIISSDVARAKIHAFLKNSVPNVYQIT